MVSGFRFPVSGFRFPVSGFGFRVFGFSGFRVFGFRRSGLQAAILGRRVLIAAWRPLLRNDETTKRRNDEKGGPGGRLFRYGPPFFIRTRRRRCRFGWWSGRCCWPGWGPAGRRVR